MDIYAKSDILCVKGRVKCTNTHMPGSLGQMCVCIFDEQTQPGTMRHSVPWREKPLGLCLRCAEDSAKGERHAKVADKQGKEVKTKP